MKFTSSKSISSLYGYTFKKGVVVEVKEPNLIRKFSNYSFLVEVPEYTVVVNPQTFHRMKKEDYQNQLDEAGIKYRANASEKALKKLVEGMNNGDEGGNQKSDLAAAGNTQDRPVSDSSGYDRD